FDSGASLGAFIVDSTFCSAHPSILSNLSPDTIAPYGCAWSVLRMPASMYTIVPTIKVGNANLIYDKMLVYNLRDYMGGTQLDGVFNIPQNDTVNIWEFNFEHHYMAIHSFQDFIMPENCILIPFVRGNDKSSLFYVNLPLNIRCADGDTLMLTHTYLVDTGMPQDIALMAQASELSFFSKKKNAVWTQAPSGYYSHHNVNATLFGGIQLDSLRIYIFDQPNQVPCDYLIGLNFLKRFNVFFDMKSQRLGLQPIKNYERVVNPRKKRFHMSSRMNSHGKIIITKIADYEGNYVKESGLLEGDEIIAINEIPIKMISMEEDAELSRQDT
ncbi:PDZ domain-containing protein, partial [Bacteroides fragilis]|nr:PDZ domain-containing protein [Bacteroides fragilis]